MLKVEEKLNNGEPLNFVDVIQLIAVSIAMCAGLFFIFYFLCGVAYAIGQ